MKLVDIEDLKSFGEGRKGSIPLPLTKSTILKILKL